MSTWEEGEKRMLAELRRMHRGILKCPSKVLLHEGKNKIRLEIQVLTAMFLVFILQFSLTDDL